MRRGTEILLLMEFYWCKTAPLIGCENKLVARDSDRRPITYGSSFDIQRQPTYNRLYSGKAFCSIDHLC